MAKKEKQPSKFIRWITDLPKKYKVIAIVIFLGGGVIAIGEFTSAVTTLRDTWNQLVSNEKPKPKEDANELNALLDSLRILLSDKSDSLVFTEIPDAKSKSDKFYLDPSGKGISMRFVSDNFKLDFVFTAPSSMTIRQLDEALMNHFEFHKHARPYISSTMFDIVWSLCKNRVVLDSENFDLTLEQAGFKKEDVVSYVITMSRVREANDPNIKPSTLPS